jgi:(1->4)-alpha-D-glucan 1-alpha-D-glucosylmutase
LVPYLAELGVSDLYASPYMRARPGSTHGYDVIDHNSLNPEIGTPEDYERLVETLHEHGMSQLLDIVPNHMGIGSDNPWWMSVLEHGPASPHATFFDIDWYPTNRPRLHGKVLLPVLGDHYRAVLEGGEISLSFSAEDGKLSASYYEHECPLDPKTYPMILSNLEGLPEDEHSLELESLITEFGNLPGQDATDEEALEERARDAAINKNRLARLCSESGEIARAVEERVQRLNGVVGESESFGSLHRILEEQAYRLVFWRVASDEINYRRFFAINDLAGVRVEDEEVFEATHRFFLDLVGSGKVSGLRIDHPDGTTRRSTSNAFKKPPPKPSARKKRSRSTYSLRRYSLTTRASPKTGPLREPPATSSPISLMDSSWTRTVKLDWIGHIGVSSAQR